MGNIHTRNKLNTKVWIFREEKNLNLTNQILFGKESSYIFKI